MTPKRTVPLKRGKGLQRNTPLNPYSKKRFAAVTAAGYRPTSTFAPRPREPFTTKAKVQKAQTDTGPTRSVRGLVSKRSGGMCEWPGCPEQATDKQHRLGRKQGGRHGEMRERLNGAAWLIDCCRFHHERVTSAYGEVLEEAKQMGWVLTERQDALRVPVLTRHDEEPVWFLPDGRFLIFAEGCA